eukprot:Rhum_TRINITY_DN12076_c1_g1::Rhum_TRINITY_DN12076_c1_g1_i1::g.49095::m.49095
MDHTLRVGARELLCVGPSGVVDPLVLVRHVRRVQHEEPPRSTNLDAGTLELNHLRLRGLQEVARGRRHVRVAPPARQVVAFAEVKVHQRTLGGAPQGDGGLLRSAVLVLLHVRHAALQEGNVLLRVQRRVEDLERVRAPRRHPAVVRLHLERLQHVLWQLLPRRRSEGPRALQADLPAVAQHDGVAAALEQLRRRKAKVRQRLPLSVRRDLPLSVPAAHLDEEVLREVPLLVLPFTAGAVQVLDCRLGRHLHNLLQRTPLPLQRLRRRSRRCLLLRQLGDRRRRCLFDRRRRRRCALLPCTLFAFVQLRRRRRLRARRRRDVGHPLDRRHGGVPRACGSSGARTPAQLDGRVFEGQLQLLELLGLGGAVLQLHLLRLVRHKVSCAGNHCELLGARPRVADGVRGVRFEFEGPCDGLADAAVCEGEEVVATFVQSLKGDLLLIGLALQRDDGVLEAVVGDGHRDLRRRRLRRRRLKVHGVAVRGPGLQLVHFVACREVERRRPALAGRRCETELRRQHTHVVDRHVAHVLAADDRSVEDQRVRRRLCDRGVRLLGVGR